MRIFVLGVVLLLAGCSAPSPGFPSGSPGSGREVPLEVLDAERRPGRCFDGATAFGDVCDVLTVFVDNSEGANPLDVGQFWWRATDVDGRTAKNPGTDGYEEVPPGQTLRMTLAFTRDETHPVLVELRYDRYSLHGQAAVPAY